MKYDRRVIEQVNKEEAKLERQKCTPNRGMIKLLGIRQNKAIQIKPIMAWLMFQIICLLYHNIKNKEEINTMMLLTSMSENIQVNKQNETFEDSKGKTEKFNPL